MSKKVYVIAAILVLLGVVGFVGAQISGTKEEGAAVVTEKKETKPTPVEEKIEVLRKNQEKILLELKEIKQNQEEILKQTEKIFINMRRK